MKKHKKAFSLIELMVAVLIMVVLLPALFRTIVGYSILNNATRDRTVASADARLVIEQIRSVSRAASSTLATITGTDWTTWAANNGANSLSTEVVTVTYTDLDATGTGLDDDPLAVTVNIGWQGREGRAYNLSSSTLITLY